MRGLTFRKPCIWFAVTLPSLSARPFTSSPQSRYTLRVGEEQRSEMISIRPATIDDAALLRTMIRELAEFEHELDLCVIEEADLARDGFGESPRFRALIAAWGGNPAGYALVFNYYSTWAGRGLFLEDLFVREAFRGKGMGKALLAAVARIAVAENCYEVHWEVLDWNERAIEFYKSLGAEFGDRWRPVMLSGDSLRRLAEKA
jgi:GNAT superfamily N-acetyltransferase